MAVTAKMVKELREKTGVGMMDCKKALAECDGDLEAAVDWLRKKGLSSASKKSGRVAAEGKVVTASANGVGVLLEVNSETDFAAKNEKFIAFAQQAVELALENKSTDIEAFKNLPFPGTGRTAGEELTHQISTIGENMNLRRVALLEVSQGSVASYIHMGGKIGVLVGLESDSDNQEALAELGKKVAMHVAASSPPYLNRQSVPEADLKREKDILSDQARASGKPEQIIEKMVMGRINKFYGENCLLEQPFVMDPDQKVGNVVEAAAKALGAKISVSGFQRFVLGEGIQKRDDDFASEVAKQVG
ncbi:MAG: elongation factor Ts [Magnetococcales bacterium]|nr:elongation factor Ts [Magnetococcales bacterium]